MNRWSLLMVKSISQAIMEPCVKCLLANIFSRGSIQKILTFSNLTFLSSLMWIGDMSSNGFLELLLKFFYFKIPSIYSTPSHILEFRLKFFFLSPFNSHNFRKATKSVSNLLKNFIKCGTSEKKILFSEVR